MSEDIELLPAVNSYTQLGGGFIHKEELIQLHTLMVQMKKFFEEKGHGEFSQYQSLQISPIHVHRSKAEHKHAIFILGKEIASVMAHDEFSGPEEPWYECRNLQVALLMT